MTSRPVKDLPPAAWALRVALPCLAELSDHLYTYLWGGCRYKAIRGTLPSTNALELNRVLPPALRFTPNTLTKVVTKGHAGEPLEACFRWKFQAGWLRLGEREPVPVSSEYAQQLREGKAPTLEGWLEPHAHAAYQHFAGHEPD